MEEMKVNESAADWGLVFDTLLLIAFLQSDAETPEAAAEEFAKKLLDIPESVDLFSETPEERRARSDKWYAKEWEKIKQEIEEMKISEDTTRPGNQALGRERTTMNTEITLLKWPGEEDWVFAKSCALVTIGKHSGKAPDMEWKHKMLRAKHSPIRTLNFAFYLHNVPYYVSTHLARHVHSVPFIKSQRNDRQSDYDRNAARQDAPVDMIWYMNAEELLTVASKRLCRKADPATQEIIKRMRTLVLDHCPEFRGLMAPPCAFMDECPEMEPCKEGQA
jgi:hypothetical protein